MSIRRRSARSTGPPEAPRRAERAAGLISTVFGLGALLAMLGLATNVALGLWSRTRTESIAYEATRAVATAPEGADLDTVQTEAAQRACEALGDRCGEVRLEFESSPADTFVALHVRAPGVRLLPRMVAGGAVVGDLDRTIRIHRERR